MKRRKWFIKIVLVSLDARFLGSFIREILIRLKKIQLKVLIMPKEKAFYRVLRSAFVNKKSVEEFSLRWYKETLSIQRKELKKLLFFFKQTAVKHVSIKIKGCTLIR